jgi:hypothetical protein
MALAAGGLAVGLLAFAEQGFRGEADAATEPATLQPVSAFAAIKNKDERAVALLRKPAR